MNRSQANGGMLGWAGQAGDDGHVDGVRAGGWPTEVETDSGKARLWREQGGPPECLHASARAARGSPSDWAASFIRERARRRGRGPGL